MDFIEIENGKLFRLEGWEFEKGNFNIDSYRSADLNWENIEFEGYFVEPHEKIDLHNGLDLLGFISQQVAFKEKEGFFTENNSEYILFLIPQDCDSLIAGKNYPNDTSDWSCDEVGDSDAYRTQIFICKKGKYTSRSFYQMMPIIGMSWEEAFKEKPKWLFGTQK